MWSASVSGQQLRQHVGEAEDGVDRRAVRARQRRQRVIGAEDEARAVDQEQVAFLPGPGGGRCCGDLGGAGHGRENGATAAQGRGLRRPAILFPLTRPLRGPPSPRPCSPPRARPPKPASGGCRGQSPRPAPARGAGKMEREAKREFAIRGVRGYRINDLRPHPPSAQSGGRNRGSRWRRRPPC